MKNVKLLDCTLRDGGRIIDCAFPDNHIMGITEGLTEAGVDIIELGFLHGKYEYQKNSTFFTEIEQIKQFIPQNKKNSMYVAFADYGKEFGMWDFSKLPECDGSSITGIRIGFRKKDLYDAIDTFHIVKNKGYALFIQGVESLNYTDKEMLEVIEVVNKIKPYSFGIVDTYGAMYKDDVLRLYHLVDHNLHEDIAIDFHSHNNLQLSFAFAQEIVECSGKRNVILDATLEGLGKGTGNLNTELIMDYLIRKHNYSYDIDALLDTIDEYIYLLKKEHNWTYSIPYFMAGVYSSHANNIIYLTEKHRLSTKDIKHIISMIEPEKRKRYDYDNIEKLYVDYSSAKVDDRLSLEKLQREIKGRKVLILVPGYSLKEYENQIQKTIDAENPVVISVNFVDDTREGTYSFFGNKRRYKSCKNSRKSGYTIVTSNINPDNCDDLLINYNRLIKREYELFDNSTIMLLNLLHYLNNDEIMIAGFDGLDADVDKAYAAPFYENYNNEEDYEQINEKLKLLLKDYSKFLPDKRSVRFITPSRFESVFK